MKVIIQKEEDETQAEYEVNENEHTVLNLKEKIAANNFGPIIKEQRLEYNGKRLKDNQLISKYAIKNGALIILKNKSASSSSCSSTSSESD